MLPEGPGPDTDASTIGRIVTITKHGARSYAQVTMPTGLEFLGDRLYASAWGVAAFLGMPSAGES